MEAMKMVLFVIIVVIISVLFVDGIQYYRCGKYAEATNRKTIYKHFDQCYTQSESNVWYTLDEYENSLICSER